MDEKLRKIKWEINGQTTIPGRIGNNVFQHDFMGRHHSKDLMIPLLTDNVAVNLLNPFRKFGEMLHEKSLEKVLECYGMCVITATLRNSSTYITYCLFQKNKYGCVNCLYYKENLRDILNLGGEEMLKRMHRRLEHLEVFRIKGKIGINL